MRLSRKVNQRLVNQASEPKSISSENTEDEEIQSTPSQDDDQKSSENSGSSTIGGQGSVNKEDMLSNASQKERIWRILNDLSLKNKMPQGSKSENLSKATERMEKPKTLTENKNLKKSNKDEDSGLDKMEMYLDDEMLRFISKFDFENYECYKGFSYCDALLTELIRIIQLDPNKYKEKDFDTINKMVEEINKNPFVYYSDEFHGQKMHVQCTCTLTLSEWKLEDLKSEVQKTEEIKSEDLQPEKQKNIQIYKNLPIVHYRVIRVVFEYLEMEKYDIVFEILEELFSK